MSLTTLQIFVNELWPILVVTVIVLPVLQLGRRLSLDGNATMFIFPNSIKALRGFSKDEQKRLLRKADQQAFPRWRFFLPVLIWATMLSLILALAGTLPKIVTLPASFWVTPVIAGLLVLPSGWLFERWELRCIKRFLTTPSDLSAAETPK